MWSTSEYVPYNADLSEGFRILDGAVLDHVAGVSMLDSQVVSDYTCQFRRDTSYARRGSTYYLYTVSHTRFRAENRWRHSSSSVYLHMQSIPWPVESGACTVAHVLRRRYDSPWHGLHGVVLPSIPHLVGYMLRTHYQILGRHWAFKWSAQAQRCPIYCDAVSQPRWAFGCAEVMRGFEGRNRNLA